MYLIVSGQMMRTGKTPGPMFQIVTSSQIGEGPYHARCISQSCGQIIAESHAAPNDGIPSGPIGGFKTVGEAMEWCHEFIDY